MHRRIGKGSGLITLVSSRTAKPIRDRVQDVALNLTIVIPAQAGIHNHDVSRKDVQRHTIFCRVSVYGFRALLRSPGMTVLGWFERSRICAALRPG